DFLNRSRSLLGSVRGQKRMNGTNEEPAQRLPGLRNRRSDELAHLAEHNAKFRPFILEELVRRHGPQNVVTETFASGRVRVILVTHGPRVEERPKRRMGRGKLVSVDNWSRRYDIESAEVDPQATVETDRTLTELSLTNANS